MLSLMLLSHSKDIAKGVGNLALEMNGEANIYAIGGTKDGSTGSDYDKTKEKLMEALEHGQVLILFDLGSTLMTIQMIMDELTDEQLKNVFLSDAALVEGAILASVSMSANMSPEEIMEELKDLSLNKI